MDETSELESSETDIAESPVPEIEEAQSPLNGDDAPPPALDVDTPVETPPVPPRRIWGMMPTTFAVVLLLFVVGYIKLLLIYTDVFDTGLGDGSSRIIISTELSLDENGYFTKRFWTNYWSYGPFMTQGVFLKLFRAAGVAEHINHVKFILGQASVLFLIGVYFTYRAMSRLLDRRSGLYAVLALLAIEIINLMSLSSNAETYAFFYTAMGMWILSFRPGNAFIAILAGVPLMMAQLCRSEVAIITLIVAGILLINRKYLSSLFLVLVGDSMVYVKPIAMRLLEIEGTSVFNMKQQYRAYDEWSGPLETIVNATRDIAKTPDALLLSVGLLGSLFLILNKRLRYVPLVVVGYPILMAAMWTVFIQTRFADRFWYMELVILCVAAGIVMGRFTGFLQERWPGRWTRIVSGAALALFALVSLVSFSRVHAKEHHSHLATYIAIPDEVQAARRWLRANIRGKESLQFDYLRGWDQYLHAQTDSAAFRRTSLGYANGVSPRSKFDWASLNGDLALQKTVRAHLHILDYRPRFLVLAGEKLIHPEDFEFYAKHKRWSYLRPYMTESDENGIRYFQSAYVEHTPIPLKMVYRNSHIEVFEASYPEPLRPAS